MSTKEEQQGRILPREDFHLLTFKLNKGSGVMITHNLGGIDPQKQSNDCPADPHPDLINVLNELQPYMAESLGLTEGWDAWRSNNKDGLDGAEKAKNGYDATVARMNVNGITYKGDVNSEKYGVSITGSFKTPHGGSVGCAVPKITFQANKLGTEEDVKEICDRINDEVYNYLILKKKAQSNVEDQAEGFDNNGGVQTSIIDEEEKTGLQ